MLFYRSQDYVPKAQNGIVTYLPGRSPEEMRANPDNYDLFGNYKGDDYMPPKEGLGAVGMIGAGGAGLLRRISKFIISKRMLPLASYAQLARTSYRSSRGLAQVKAANAFTTKAGVAASKTNAARKLNAFTTKAGIAGKKFWNGANGKPPSALKYAGIGIVGMGTLGLAGKLHQKYNTDNTYGPVQPTPTPLDSAYVTPKTTLGVTEVPVSPVTPPASSIEGHKKEAIVNPVIPVQEGDVEGLIGRPGGLTKAQTKDHLAAKAAKDRIISMQTGYARDYKGSLDKFGADGIWGEETQAAYDRAITEQKELKEAGFYDGDIDGILGKKTIAARSKYKSKEAKEMYEQFQDLEKERKNSDYKIGGDIYKKGGILYNK